MVDTLEDIDKPYREGDSDKVKRDLKWPTFAEAMHRIAVLTEDQTEGPTADMAARDLVVLMRELGRVIAEVSHLKYERQEIIDNALNEQTALEDEIRRLREAAQQARAFLFATGYAEPVLAALDAALATEPASGEQSTTDLWDGMGNAAIASIKDTL